MGRMIMARDLVPDYGTPNKKKRFVEAECQRILKAVNSDRECYLGGIYGTRRQKAILNALDRAEEEFKSLGLVSVVETFTKNELMPFNNYNHLDDNADLRIGAALWILDKLRASGAIRKAYGVLPDVSGDADVWYLPIDFNHPCYANDLIQSVIHVITNRYGTRRDVVITEGNAGRKIPGEAYQELLDLLPQEDVQKACDEFKARIWELASRFMKGQAYFDREIEIVVAEPLPRQPPRAATVRFGQPTLELAAREVARHAKLSGRWRTRCQGHLHSPQ